MKLIGIFPQNSALYIVLGMISTETHFKKAAFLKCIQIDPESSLSVNLLASLYLKEKDYFNSSKLYLKSLELSLINPQANMGLSICFFSLIGH